MKRAILSCSGGMDSTGLLINLLSRGFAVTIVNFDYGSKQNSTELQRLTKNIEYLTSKGFDIKNLHIDLSSIMGMFYSSLTRDDIETPEGHYEEDNMKITVVPNRNAIFASIIYGLALSQYKDTGDDVSICLGIHSGDHTIYPDATSEFMNAIYKAFSIGNWDSEHIHVDIPYIQGNKSTILKDTWNNCEKLGLDFNTVLGNTITCYKPDGEGRSCGKCGSCTERLEAFELLGKKDPIPYI